jgi:hypothetical protein
MVTALVLQLPRTAPLRSVALPDCRSLEVATVVGAQLQSLNLTGCSELHSLSLQCDSLDELSLSLVRVVTLTLTPDSSPSVRNSTATDVKSCLAVRKPTRAGASKTATAAGRRTFNTHVTILARHIP